MWDSRSTSIPTEGFKPSTISSDRTVVRQFVEYLRLYPFDYLQIDNVALDLEKPDNIVFDDVLRLFNIYQIDQLTADFFSKYKMGGVQGELEVKVTTLECRWSGLRRQLSMKGLHLNKLVLTKLSVYFRMSSQILRVLY